MKKQIIVLIISLLLLPMASQAAGVLRSCKEELIRKSDYHKKKALEEMEALSAIQWYIPNLESRNNMRLLISSSLGAATLTSAKAKIMCVGISLIGELAASSYDKYCELRDHITNATYHFEMADFYNQVSLKSGNYSATDQGTTYFLQAIDNLTLCDMLTTKIEDVDDRWALSNQLTLLRYRCLKYVNNPQRKWCRQMSTEAYTFFENLSEITAEYEDQNLVLSIIFHASETYEYLYKAETTWGIR